MRNLLLKMQMSADGFVGAPTGDVEWAFHSFDDGLTAWLVDTLWQAGAHLMGRKLYHDMAAHWPTSSESFAPPMNELPKLVFSKTLTDPAWAGTAVHRGDLGEEIARLKQLPGKDLLAHGGASFAQSLVRLDLVDEYRLVVHPVVLGAGLPLFPDLPSPRHLRLISSQRFEKGAVANVYRRE